MAHGGQPWYARCRAAAMPLRQPRIRCVIKQLCHRSAAPTRTQPRSCMVMPATPATDCVRTSSRIFCLSDPTAPAAAGSLAHEQDHARPGPPAARTRSVIGRIVRTANMAAGPSGWVGPHGPAGVSFLVVGMVSAGQPGARGLEAGDRGGDLCRPGPAGGEAEPLAAAAADEVPGAGEEPQPQPFWFPLAAGPARASICVRARRSHASATISHHSGFWSKPWRGGCAARCPWRSGSGPRTWPGAGGVVPGRRPRFVLAKQVNWWPSLSVNRSCAPGWGRSLRAMTRIPLASSPGPAGRSVP